MSKSNYNKRNKVPVARYQEVFKIDPLQMLKNTLATEINNLFDHYYTDRIKKYTNTPPPKHTDFFSSALSTGNSALAVAEKSVPIAIPLVTGGAVTAVSGLVTGGITIGVAVVLTAAITGVKEAICQRTYKQYNNAITILNLDHIKDPEERKQIINNSVTNVIKDFEAAGKLQILLDASDKDVKSLARNMVVALKHIHPGCVLNCTAAQLEEIMCDAVRYPQSDKLPLPSKFILQLRP
jgi:hypothetical protein